MKVYAVGNEAELAELSEFCRANKWEFVRLKGVIGRPRANYPVQKVLDTYRREKTVRGVARMLGIPAPTVSRILKQAGVSTEEARRERWKLRD